MEYIVVGKFINTHGIKGEVRIQSRFKYKDLVFKPGMTLYLGPLKKGYVIQSYRRHKDLEMVTFKEITNINEILPLKGCIVYIDKEALELGDRLPLTADLIGYEVELNGKRIGQITEVMETPANDVLVVSEKRILIPYVQVFVKKLDTNQQKISIEMEGMNNED